MTEISYCTREQVQDEMGSAESIDLNNRIDRACQQAARDVEGLLHRKFYPETLTRTFDQPDSATLWLNGEELAGVPVITSGAEQMAGTDFILQPNSGPPYRWIDQNLAGSVFWQSTDTYQRSISVTGEWNYPVLSTTNGGVLSGPISSSAVSMTLSNSSPVGVGSLLLIGGERILVTEKSLSLTGATLSDTLSASKGQTAFSVSSGAALNIGERIFVDGEWMKVQAIAGNQIVATRATNGTVLAAHTAGVQIWAPRAMTIERAVTGSTASSHSGGDTAVILLAPSLVREAALALAVNSVNQGGGGWSSSWGSGSRVGQSYGATRQKAPGGGLEDLMDRVYTRYGLKVRTRAVK